MFTKDKNFYRTLARLMVMVVLQNVIAYSVNMADNLMLGAYCQDALSGAAAVSYTHLSRPGKVSLKRKLKRYCKED